MALGPAGTVGGATVVGLPLEQLELQVTRGLGIRLEFLRHKQLVPVQVLVLEAGAHANVS
jgi:hypothetical protein